MFSIKPPLKGISRTFDPRDRSDIVSLDRNEWVGPWTDAQLEEMLGKLSWKDLANYPTLEPTYQRLAPWVGVPRERLLLGPGSDSLIRSLFEVFVSEGDRVVQLSPSYAMYDVYTRMYGGQAVKVEFAEDRTFSLEGLLAELTPGTRLLTLANPNQPSGTVLSLEDLDRILVAAGAHDIVTLVDEAYYYFHDRSAVELLDRHPHLVVTRTFSKAMGMAGVRVGLAIAQPELIGLLDRVRPTCEISGVAQRLVEYVLDHPTLPWDNARLCHEGQAFLAERFASLGLESIRCPANFMMVRVPEPRRSALVKGLAERGYWVRANFSEACMRDCVRITTGPPEVMAGFWKAFLESLQP